MGETIINRVPGPSTPDQNVYHARTHFREERGNFSKIGANSRNQEKWVIFGHKSAKFLKRVNILHVSAGFHPGFHTLDLGRVFKYSFWIRHNEKYDVHRKKMFDTIYLAFTKRVLYLI